MQERDLDDEDTSEQQAIQLLRSARLARGTGEHAPIQVSLPHDVARLVRELQEPITELGRAVQGLERDDPEPRANVGAIRESLRLVEALVRDLCMALLGMSAEQAPAPSVLCGASVLVVDMDAAHAQALRAILCAHGVSVAVASSAPECLVRVAAQRPEAVILDLSLGSTFARTLGTIAPETPIIATTTAADHSSAAIALSTANAYIVGKPYSFGELVVLLEQVLMAPHRSR